MNVLQTVEVVIGTEVPVGIVAGWVVDATVELTGMERLPGVVGETSVDEDPILGAELVYSLAGGTGTVSALEAGILDFALEYDSTLVAAKDDAGATSLLVDAADVSTTEPVSVVEFDSMLDGADEDWGATSLLVMEAGDVASDEVTAVVEVSAVG